MGSESYVESFLRKPTADERVLQLCYEYGQVCSYKSSRLWRNGHTELTSGFKLFREVNTPNIPKKLRLTRRWYSALEIVT